MPMAKMESPYLTAREAMAYLKLDSQSALYRLVKRTPAAVLPPRPALSVRPARARRLAARVR